MPDRISALDYSQPQAGVAVPGTPYNDAYYLKQQDVSSRSAGCVAPIVISLLPVNSAIDVGCGVGTWAEQFLKRGVEDVIGIDGEYVNRQLLRIPATCFQAYDLSQPIRLNRRFDLAMCMEVAEHLKESRAEGLVDDLTKLANVILFSAAIPGQGGTDHVNEQYLSYWAALFAAKGYVLLDAIRPRIWNTPECDWTYRQNAVLFVEKENELAAKLKVLSGVDYIHPYHYNEILQKLNKPTLGYLCSSLPGSLKRSLSKRLRGI
jgi:SAM-dependent methyltransferase